MIDWTLQRTFYTDEVNIICGCDEAGRGPLAGPVFAAAVILPKDCHIDGLGDSKKLSERKRDELYDIIRERAVDFAIERADVAEIEAVNILNASMLAMRRAIEALRTKPDLALIDGNIVRNIPVNAIAVVKGDGKIPSIAAASILAKVSRDRYCIEMDRIYPGYDFAKHKGYPTREHKEAILKYGPCPAHRMSFLKKTLYGTDNDTVRQNW